MLRRLSILMLVALAVVACSEPRHDAHGPFVAIPSPAALASGQPRFTSDGQRLFMSWVERSDTLAVLRFAERAADGWRSPIDVARGSDWFVNWADTPGVVALGDGTFAAFYLQRTGTGTYDYAIRLVQSADGGRSWSDPVTPHQEGTPSEYGFVSAHPEAGGVRLVWLDGTAMAGHGAEGMHRGVMALRTAVVTRQGDVTDPVLLDDRTCECCPTAMALAAGGPVVAYRNRSSQEVRDIAVVRLADAWSQPTIPLPDGWRIEGCPVNGPALVADGDRVVLATFTGVGGGEVKAAFSEDGGATFGEAVRLDGGRPLGRVDAALTPSGAALVSWLESTGASVELRVRRVAPDGTAGESVVVARLEDSRATGMPRLAIHGDEVLVAWVATGAAPHVAVAAAPLSALE